jgi:hypothetical protein
VSKKQVENNRKNALFKAKVIIAQIEDKGYTYCQKCGHQVHQSQLELVHKKGKGRGGSATDESNLGVWCHDCHFPLGVHYNE